MRLSASGQYPSLYTCRHVLLLLLDQLIIKMASPLYGGELRRLHDVDAHENHIFYAMGMINELCSWSTARRRSPLPYSPEPIALAGFICTVSLPIERLLMDAGISSCFPNLL